MRRALLASDLTQNLTRWFRHVWWCVCVNAGMELYCIGIPTSVWKRWATVAYALPCMVLKRRSTGTVGASGSGECHLNQKQQVLPFQSQIDQIKMAS